MRTIGVARQARRIGPRQRTSPTGNGLASADPASVRTPRHPASPCGRPACVTSSRLTMSTLTRQMLMIPIYISTRIRSHCTRFAPNRSADCSIDKHAAMALTRNPPLLTPQHDAADSLIPISRLVTGEHFSHAERGNAYQVLRYAVQEGVEWVSWRGHFEQPLDLALCDDSERVSFSFNCHLRGHAACEFDDGVCRAFDVQARSGNISYGPGRKGRCITSRSRCTRRCCTNGMPPHYGACWPQAATLRDIAVPSCSRRRRGSAAPCIPMPRKALPPRAIVSGCRDKP